MLRVNRRTAPQAIADREEFRNSTGSLSGIVNPRKHSLDTSRLHGPDFLKFINDEAHMVYVVKSYDTPIAWETTDGQVHKVSQKFTVTTSQHQGLLYMM